MAAVQDLAGAGVNGERRQRADRSDVVRLGVAPLGGKRSRDGLRVLLADGSRREPGRRDARIPDQQQSGE